MQRITTREPDDAQLEVALLSLQYALVDDFPELDRAALRGEEETAGEDTPK